MSVLRQSLDKAYFSNTLLTSKNKRSRREMYHLLYKIDNNYSIYDTDPLIQTVLNKFPIPRKLIIKKEKVIINKEINTLTDLIDLLNNYPLVL